MNEQQLADWIDGATGAIRYLGPAITETLAHKIIAAEKRTGERNQVVIELDDEMDRSGYGQTAGVRVLHDNGATLRSRTGLRIAALTAPGIGVVWSPIAERVDSIEQVMVNGIWMHGPELYELGRWMRRMTEELPFAPSASQDDQRGTPYSGKSSTFAHTFDQQSNVHQGEPVPTPSQNTTDKQFADATNLRLDPPEPPALLHPVDDKDIMLVETHLRDHPPRNFKEERQTEVYQGYVGFIEIHVTGASLSDRITLTVPNELTELGLENDLRTRLSERMRIDLSESVDLGARDVNRRVDAFREIFTRQMGPPLGRIYKKSDWPIMQTKWAEVQLLVNSANNKINRHMQAAVEKAICEASKEWAEAIKRNPNIRDKNRYTFEKIRHLLLLQWDRRGHATKMELQMFAKDLTWGTLNNLKVRKKIEEAYPELCETGLYKSRPAWAS